MNNRKQTTLFQSWGRSKQANASAPETAAPNQNVPKVNDRVVDLCDSDDDLLAQAMQDATWDKETTGSTNSTNVTNDHTSDVCNISLGAEMFAEQNLSCTQTVAPEGFDKTAGKLWIYPTNYPVREYQFNIVQQALFKNTLVTLPTGLGKTFIAAVVMYNFYRWYPQGKIVFMAPTKPLVAQQIEACYNIMGIPQSDTAEMTGNMSPSERKKSWTTRRVFFLTPQVLSNDLSRGTCPAALVKCLVIDEAHKAQGKHAYCQVVKELVNYTRDFRILALSATPGSDIKAVQQVLVNLLISHIELRTEESNDIKQYSHERKVEKIVVPLGDELDGVKKKYLQILEVVYGRLKRHGVLYNRESSSLSKFLILKARDAFRQNPPPRLPQNMYGIVEGDFALAISLCHGLELLQIHGSRSLFNFLEGIISGEKSSARTKTELNKNADFLDLMALLKAKYVPGTTTRPSQAPCNSGHPKMDKLEQVVLEHFQKFTEMKLETRVMIFSQYRDSVTEITDILKRHMPMVKPMSFIGQSSAGKATKGFTQKEQLKVMKEFREGGYNTLVSTCVGEEGLDIGDVDLIICFDAHKSPIRLVQRMGRTGRKREGRIVMLVTQGKEEQIYNQSQLSKKSIHKAILNGAKSLHFYPNNPRMVPDTYNPSCHKMHITVRDNFVGKTGPSGSKSIKSKSSKKHVGITHYSKDEEEIITEEEYKELCDACPDKKDIKKLPRRGRLLCLPEDDLPEIECESGVSLSLTEYLPWQNKLQDTYLTGHSQRSKALVNTVQFIELQQTMSKDVDPYGEEMALNLNEDDIISEHLTSKDKGIKSFLIPAVGNALRKKTNTLRRSELLKDFDVPNVESDSDEELPDYLGRDSLQKEKLKTSIEKKIHEPSKKKITRKLLPKKTKLFSDDGGSRNGLNKRISKVFSVDYPKTTFANQSVISLINDDSDSDFQENNIDEDILEEEHIIHPNVEQVDSNSLNSETLYTKNTQNYLHLAGKSILDMLPVVKEDCDCDFIVDFPDETISSAPLLIWQVLDELDNVHLDENESSFDESLKSETKDAVDYGVMMVLGTNLSPHESANISPQGSFSEQNDLPTPFVKSIHTDKQDNPTPHNTRTMVSNDSDGFDSVLDDGYFDLLIDKELNKSEQEAMEDLDSCKQLNTVIKSPFEVKPSGNVSPHCQEIHVPVVNKVSPKCVDALNQRSDDYSKMDLSKEEQQDVSWQENNKIHNFKEVEMNSQVDFLLADNDLLEELEDDSGDSLKECIADLTPEKDVKLSADQVLMIGNVEQENGISEAKPALGNNSGKKEPYGKKCDTIAKERKCLNRSLASMFDDSMDDYIPALAGNHNANSCLAVESQVTFTQALACIHDSEELLDSPKCDQNEGETAASSLVRDSKDKHSESVSYDDVGQIPQFDLGFDFENDDDIIPPSPFESQSTSQKSVSLSQSFFVKSRKSLLPAIEKCPQNISSLGDCEQGERGDKENINTGSVCESEYSKQNQTLGRNNLSIIAENEIESKDDELAHFSDEDLCNELENDFQEDFELTHDDIVLSPVLVSKKKLSQLSQVGKKDVPYKSTFESPLSVKELMVSSDRSSTPLISKTNAIESEHMGDNSSEEDDSFILKRPIKKCVPILQDTPSPTNKFKSDLHGNDDFKTPTSIIKKGNLVKRGEHVNKSARISFCLPDKGVDEDFDDFHDSSVSTMRKKSTVSFGNLTDKYGSNDSVKSKRKKSKSPSSDFIEEEAELSGSDLDDEEEESDGDYYEASFVNDATQQLSSQEQDGMHAVYLQSIQSPGARHGKFKLKYDQYNKMDILSQADHDEEPSQYMADSFCVDDEDEDEEMNLDDIMEGEVTLLQENSLHPDMTYIGRRTRWSKPAVASKPKKTEKGKTKISVVAGRRRIKKVADSSSDEEEKDVGANVLSPGLSQAVKVVGGPKRGRVLLSSDSDEGVSIQCNKKQKGESSSSDLTENGEFQNSRVIVPPVMTRLKNNSESCIASVHNEGDLIHSSDAISLKHQRDEDQPVSAEELKRRRLEIIKKKQEVFRSNLEKQKQGHGPSEQRTTVSDIKNDSQFLPYSKSVSEDEKLVIFVDTKELNGSQNIVSQLRFKHFAIVEVAQLVGCDYVVSTRMGVDRKLWSEFSNGSNRLKLIDRIQCLKETYERPALVVENDPVKGTSSTGKNKMPVHWTKYVDSTIVQLLHASIKLYFTDNQEETADILAGLCELEVRKGCGIVIPKVFSKQKQQAMNFYTSLPKLSYINALYLCNNFRCIRDFVNSSIEEVSDKGKISAEKSENILKFVQDNVDVF